LTAVDFVGGRDCQIMVAAVATGSHGKTLNSSFANRDANEYKVFVAKPLNFTMSLMLDIL
jgi:hypothetical protein